MLDISSTRCCAPLSLSFSDALVDLLSRGGFVRSEALFRRWKEGSERERRESCAGGLNWKFFGDYVVFSLKMALYSSKIEMALNLKVLI